MIKLHDGGAYLVNGTEIIPDNAEAQAAVTAKTGKTVTKQGSCTADDRIWYFEGS